MYDELVKRLRKLSGTENIAEFDEAADAIEELSSYEKLYEELTDKGQKMARKLLDAYPRWISVEDALPENQQFVLAWKDEKPKGFACICLWTDKTGWAFKNITHWMPLPEPPKEET